jgi:asparagine synthase (glutamine-hydrolysing)
MFHLMDGASSVLPSMYLFHGLFAQTRDRGCDLLLLSEWGNRTFSSKGEWGFAEYLVTGQWRQLAMALSRNRHDDRSFLRRFLALSIAPLLPSKAYLALRRAIKPNVELPFERYVPLSKAYRVESGAEERMHRSGHDLDIGHPRNRRHWLELNVRASDAEEAEIYQAFEQLYGVRQRDPTAYRPLAEFCFGLPTRMYMRNGEVRWLAKQLNKGIMPEEQRQNVLNGRWDADWHLRIGRRRSEYLAELDRIGEDSRLARMLDLPRVRAALADFPAETPTDSRMWTLECALPRLLLTARFVHWAEGKNA